MTAWTEEMRQAAIRSGRRQRAEQGIPDETDDLLLLDRVVTLLDPAASGAVRHAPQRGAA